VLRAVRREAGLTLRQAAARSRGQFTPSGIAGYERAERAISLARFSSLADLYAVPADRLLTRVLTQLRPERSSELVIHIGRLPLIHGREREIVAEFIHVVKAQRHDYLSDLITLRSGDLETMALRAGDSPRKLLEILRPALSIEPSASKH
jgi:transcriptional regulator with XRE-family HTH domain